MSLIFRGMIKLAIVLVTLFGMLISPMEDTGSRVETNGAVINLVHLSTYTGEGTDIFAYDPGSKLLFVTGAGGDVQVISLADPPHPVIVSSLPYGASTAAVNGGIRRYAFPTSSVYPEGLVSSSEMSSFVEYLHTEMGIAPESMLSIPEKISPSGKSLLVVGNELSQSVTIFAVENVR